MITFSPDAYAGIDNRARQYHRARAQIAAAETTARQWHDPDGLKSVFNAHLIEFPAHT